MKALRTLALTTLGLALAIASASPAQAQTPGNHPAYLHALQDLRMMRAFLDRPTPNGMVDEESAHAIAEIDEAMREIREAAISDGKDLHDHPPIDARITPTDRFHRAREAGNAAWHDLDRDDDNSFAAGLKHRAMNHIEEANHTIDHILRRFDHE